MVFTVRVAADLFCEKENISLEFPTRPSMIELSAAVEAIYDIELRSRRPGNAPDCPFRIQQFQYYDEATQGWSELYNLLQLTDGCQIFAFQPMTELHSDAEGIIPPAKPVLTWVPSAEPIERTTVPSLTPNDRRDWVFENVKQPGSFAMTYWDLRNAIQGCRMEFLTDSVGGLFDQGDIDRDGVLNSAEWALFCNAHPSIRDSLYFRLNDVQKRYPTVGEALDAAIAEERYKVKVMEKKTREEERERQIKAMERLQSGKSAHVTNFEVREKERLLARLAEEAQRKQQRKNGLVRSETMRSRASLPGTACGIGKRSMSPPRVNPVTPGVPDRDTERAVRQTALQNLPGMPRPLRSLSPTLRSGMEKLHPKPVVRSSSRGGYRGKSSGALDKAAVAAKKGFSFAPPGSAPSPATRLTKKSETPKQSRLESPMYSPDGRAMLDASSLKPPITLSSPPRATSPPYLSSTLRPASPIMGPPVHPPESPTRSPSRWHI